MIISYSNNFVVIRAPKTGSTSLASYFLKSGLIDPEHDIYVIEDDLPDETLPLKRQTDITKIGYGVHSTFNLLQSKGAVKPEMPCVSSIRNPLEWYSSVFSFLKIRKSLVERRTTAICFDGPNSYWDSIKANLYNPLVRDLVRPQSCYFPEHSELFNTENLHEHVSKYILGRGGKVGGRIEMRKNPDNRLDVFFAELTPDRKQDILDTYAKDFELWEKAYAVHN